MNFFGNSEETILTSTGQVLEKEVPWLDNSTTLFSFRLATDTFEIHTKREVFNILDFLGSIGGILEILKSILELILLPFSEFSFTLDAISTFFIVKFSGENKVFEK